MVDSAEPMDIDQAEIECNQPDIQPSGSTTSAKTFTDSKVQCSLLKPRSRGKLNRQIKTLKQKIKRRDLKISNMKDIIRELKNSGNTNESLDTVLSNYFEGNE